MTPVTGPVIMDGAALAAARAAAHRARAAAVERARGHAPRLALVAFAGADGRVPHLERKLRACRNEGVSALPLILPEDTATTAARTAMLAHLEDTFADGVFLQFPYPKGIDGDELAAAIPYPADVDVMTPLRIRRFMTGRDELPPVTVAAALALLDGYGVDVRGRQGVLVAEPHPFSLMFHEALIRRGAAMHPLVSPDDAALEERTGKASLVVVAAGRSGLVKSSTLADGAVAIDVGYFNPGGRGDIDTAGGVGHLAALCAVPGGIGPMTVSCLIERVIRFAEDATP